MSVTARLDEYLGANDLAAVWFARPASFAWLTGAVSGPADSVVDRGSDTGVAAAGYDGDEVTVVTDTIEGQRMLEEELDDGVAVETFPWYEGTLAGAVAEHSPTPAATDFDVPGFDSVDPTPLRQPLTPAQRERYRELSGEVAAAVEAAARQASRSDTERAVAAELRGELAKRGIETPVVLVGGGERARRYRHFTPTTAALGDYALLSVTAERGGLHTSCTRTVAFDRPGWLRERTRAAMRVEATALAATWATGEQAGSAGDVFTAIQRAYDELGWAGEWVHHHQGGAAGFAGREWTATPDSDASVVLGQGYAWNPTVQGAKSEDTHLVTGSGIDCLSTTGDWPTETVTAVGYDRELSRHTVLDA